MHETAGEKKKEREQKQEWGFSETLETANSLNSSVECLRG